MTQTGTAKFGMIGLAVMGSNLALNVADHGYPVAVWNREVPRVDEFVAQNPGQKIIGTRTLAEFVAALERPRRIMMLIKAGDPVDQDHRALREEALHSLLPREEATDSASRW